MRANSEDFDTSKSKLILAEQLVHLVWGSAKRKEIFSVNYEGAQWEVIVQVK